MESGLAFYAGQRSKRICFKSYFFGTVTGLDRLTDSKNCWTIDFRTTLVVKPTVVPEDVCEREHVPVSSDVNLLFYIFGRHMNSTLNYLRQSSASCKDQLHS